MLENRGREYYVDLSLKLNKIVLYRNVLQDGLINDIRLLIHMLCKEDFKKNEIENLYYNLKSKLISTAENLGLRGNLLKSYILYSVLKNENVFSLACEKYSVNLEKSIYNIASKDMIILKELINLDLSYLKDLVDLDNNEIEKYIPTLNRDSITEFEVYKKRILEAATVKEMIDEIIKYYYSVGSGESANYITFRWNNEKGLIGVRNYDAIKLDSIIGYRPQKDLLIKNTEAFLNGFEANNVLLVGARGTGKSSSVKALINEYSTRGLRLVEVRKDQLIYLNDILEKLRDKGKRFIIFIDDLSFEEDEIEYKQMKSVLDGGIEQKPSNVLIYATSNRRHLIKEVWSDNKDIYGEEIHASDTVNEKMSLSDRFGITIMYSSPNQREYLEIVKGIANINGLEVSADTLHKEALKWELSQNGRSGRSAKQFINYFKSTIG
jgi:predicted AAA+ superfamily ATPase